MGRAALTAGCRRPSKPRSTTGPQRTRCVGALARALAIFAAFDDPIASAENDELEPGQAARRVRELARRDFLHGGVAAAAVGAVAVSASWAYDRRGQYQTAKGEIRSVPLADGSVIWMNTDTALKVRYEQGVRHVSLTGARPCSTSPRIATAHSSSMRPRPACAPWAQALP